MSFNEPLIQVNPLFARQGRQIVPQYYPFQRLGRAFNHSGTAHPL